MSKPSEKSGAKRRRGISSYPAVNRRFSQKNPIELLEDRGLISTESAASEIESMSAAQAEKIASDLFGFMDQDDWKWDSDAPQSAFNSLASASFRGDTGCYRLECRAQKLNALGHYAALYADRVFVPTALPPPTHLPHPDALRSAVRNTVVTLLELRPLIEERIVVPVAQAMHWCEDCARIELSKYEEGRNVAKQQAALHLNDFEFVYSPVEALGTTGGMLRIRGPEEYIEHGGLVRLLQRPPSWLRKRVAPNEKYKLPVSLVKKAGLVNDVFERMASDWFFHQAYGLRKL